MTREEANLLMKKHLSNKNLRKHVYAVEAVMRSLAQRFDGDEEAWGLAGLLHDLDYELTLEDPQRHSYLTVEWLRETGGIDEEVLHAILAHAGHVERQSVMDKAIYCADPTTGFLVACALMHPKKQLAALDVEFMLRRFKEKRFAAGADRDQIASCSELGLGLEEFLLLSRDAMIGISDTLGL